MMEIGSIYGKLGRVGVLTPFGAEVAITDFQRNLHPDIQIAEMLVPLEELSPAGLADMNARAEEQVRMFPIYAPIDLCFFSCTSGSLIGGNGYDRLLCRRLKQAAKAREACTTTTAVLSALKALQSRRLSIITPYPDDVNAREKSYFESEGYAVTNIASIKTKNPRDSKYIPLIEPEEIYRFALQHVDPRADTLFLSCTGLTVFSIIEALEHKLSIPVVSSNQCAAWMIGKFFGCHAPHASQLGAIFSK